MPQYDIIKQVVLCIGHTNKERRITLEAKALNILNDLSEHIFIKINSCNSTIQEMGWIEIKSHNDYDIWYILSGDVYVKVGTKIYTASEGDIVFFYPNMTYTAYNDKYNCEFISILILK